MLARCSSVSRARATFYFAAEDGGDPIVYTQETNMRYAKAVVAVIGSAVTAALAIFPAGSSTYNALTILSAALTAAGVYLVPNKT